MRKALSAILLAVLLTTPALAQGRRYYVNTIYSWWPQYTDLSLFRKFVDESKQKGVNSICLDVPWNIEDKRGRYDFSASDERMDYIVSHNMSVFIRVNTTLLGKNTPRWLTEDMLMCTPNGKVYRRESDGAAIASLAHPVVRQRILSFFDAVSRHYGTRYERHASGLSVVALSPAFNLEMGSEYQPDIDLDYSKAAKADFGQWIRKEYKDIKILNSLWGTSYAKWNDVSLEKAHQTAKQLYFEFTLQRILGEIGSTVHKANSQMKVGLQTACVWDDSGRRSENISMLLRNMDWLFVSDAPAADHGFCADYIRTAAEGRAVSTEIDGPTQLGATNARYYNQGVRGYDHGCSAVVLNNWNLKNLRDNTAWPFLHDLGDLARKPADRPAPETAIYLSSWDLINGSAKADEYIAAYQKLTDNGKKAVDIIDDSVITSRPGILSHYKTIYLPANWSVPAASRAALLRAASRISVDKPLVAGTLDEYGRKTDPLIPAK